MPGNGCKVVVVGASAGGVEALSGLVGALPRDFPVPVLIVLHVPATGLSVLPDILRRAGRLPVTHAEDGEELRPGHVYVAPPDRHLLVSDGHVRLTRGPRENGHRPAIDTLFQSAVAAYHGGVAGVVLSGMLDDGTIGLWAVKQAGGATLVQDPEEALYASMPANAIAYAHPDYVLPLHDLTGVLVELTSGTNGRPRPVTGGPPPAPAPEPSAADAQPGKIMSFSCSECGGALWETREGAISSYRCRVGHAFTTNSLVAAHGESVERSLWAAYRALEERAAMSRRVARRLEGRGRADSAARLERQADTADRHAVELKALLDRFETPSDPAVPQG